MTERLQELKAALKGRYEIERELGHGGMATVYLANDIKHQREVAIKVLRPDLAAALGPDRFLREIRIAANLIHPHILPLYDSGEADGFLYYVMPYIEGQTLRDRINKEGELPVTETIRIIREVTDALAFAHSKGVVHRDIKPDNVMLTGGHAIVADFGVAKAVSEATGSDKLTTAGVALGTPAYMSPEQATADPHVDHRADIYAVGAMAYELLAGRTPFTGATPQSILAAHVTEQVDPVSKYRDHVSAELEALIMRCLEKKPADRWQSADEMLPHLETLATSSGGLTPVTTRPISAVEARSRFLNAKVAAGVVGVAIAGFFGTQLFMGAPPLSITVSNQRQITSSDGLEFQAVISGDGEDIVYVTSNEGVNRIWVRNLAGGIPIELAADVAGKLLPKWSPDGQRVQFISCTPAFVCETHEVSKQGGTVTAIQWESFLAPHGGSAAVRLDTIAVVLRFKSIDAPGLDTPIDLLEWDGHSGAWSPDGQRFAFVDRNFVWTLNGNIAPSGILVADVRAGTVVEIATPEFLNVSPIWMPDSRHLLFVSDRDGPRGAYIVEVGRRGPLGEPRPIPGVIEPHSISISEDGRRLVYSRYTQRSNVWSTPIPEPGDLSPADWTQETFGNQVIETFDVSSDGDSLLFDSGRSGNMDIHASRRGEEGQTQFTTDRSNDYSPAWSPDHREIVFYSLRTGSREIFVMPSTPGGVARQLTDHRTDARRPTWSPDGLSIAYNVFHEDSPYYRLAFISRGSVEEQWGEPTTVTDFQCEWPHFSPSGESLVCTDFDRIMLVDLNGLLLWEWVGETGRVGPGRFRSDGGLVLVTRMSDDSRLEFWLASPGTGAEPSLLLRVVIQNINRFMVPTDDRFFMTRSETESDLWVLDLEY